MYLRQHRTQREVLEETTVRRTRNARRWLNENLSSIEERIVEPTHNGLGLSVGIRSIRAKELLFDLHREEFSHFVQPKPTLDKNGMWTASFCFSVPFESSGCLRLPPVNKTQSNHTRDRIRAIFREDSHERL